jgi:hypothetical protein
LPPGPLAPPPPHPPIRKIASKIRPIARFVWSTISVIGANGVKIRTNLPWVRATYLQVQLPEGIVPRMIFISL